MADISKITLPNNSSYDIKDATARSKLNVLINNMATCATKRATAAKVAALTDFSLTVGATIAVKFTATDTTNPASGNLTLNVNGTGAKSIGFCRNGNKAAFNYNSARYFYNNAIRIFTYDGTYWLCMDWNPDSDAKVTAVGNHYTPAKSTTKSASGGTLTDITNSASGIQVVTGVEMDAKGHVTGVTSKALKSTDTQVTVDSALSSTSTNPVQNKVVNSALAGKAASSHTHSDYALKSKYGDTTIDVGRKADTNVGEYSTAEGYNTTASSNFSHAEGYATTASKEASHAEGSNTTASGDAAHAEGASTTASGICSHAGGIHTEALHRAEFAHGKYNQSNDDTLFSIGDGTSGDARHNAFEITTTGGKLHDKDIATTDLAGSSKSGLMSADHFNFLEKYKKIRGSSASYTFTSMQDYITVNNCYGNCTNGLVVLSGWFTSTGSAGNPAIISGSFPSSASSFVCGIIVNMDSPNTNTRLLVRHESDGTSSLQCGGSISAGKYFFIGVYTAERCAYNLPYTL